MRKTTKYISNKKLYQAMIEHNRKLNESIQNNVDKPQISNYIAECIMLICNNLSKKPNFSGYTYIQEMILDGMIDCIAAVDNFDPDKTNNPFAYFTQIAWNAFVRRIHKEKRQTYIKHKNFENKYLIDNFLHDDVSISDIDNNQMKFNEYSNDIISTYENNIIKNKKVNKKTKKVGLEKLLED